MLTMPVWTIEMFFILKMLQLPKHNPDFTSTVKTEYTFLSKNVSKLLQSF